MISVLSGNLWIFLFLFSCVSEQDTMSIYRGEAEQEPVGSTSKWASGIIVHYKTCWQTIFLLGCLVCYKHLETS